tara:strand:- start:14 stop:424 length:411 start_codon:yes stop_codon:yes gene_type:complete
MNIGEVSKFSNLPVKTIRYYEDVGFVSPQRSKNGYRYFREEDVHKLAFLKRARSLGFTIDDCRMLLQLYENENRASSDVKTIARQHLLLIDEKVKGLKEMRKTLSHLIDECAGDDRPNCPILSDLALPRSVLRRNK